MYMLLFISMNNCPKNISFFVFTWYVCFLYLIFTNLSCLYYCWNIKSFFFQLFLIDIIITVYINWFEVMFYVFGRYFTARHLSEVHETTKTLISWRKKNVYRSLKLSINLLRLDLKLWWRGICLLLSIFSTT